jgi:hypothetical protein
LIASDESSLPVLSVLTLASFSSIIARLGDTKIKSDSPDAIEIPVVAFMINDIRIILDQIDIALVKLAWDVKFTDLIRPACLWRSEELEGNTPQAFGWGFHNQYSNDFSNDLLKVSVNIIDNSHCLWESVYSNTYCPGISVGNEDTCQGGNFQI